MLRRSVVALSLVALGAGLQVPTSRLTHVAQRAVASGGLAVVLGTAALPAFASNTAAQISLDRLPPSSISVQIQDLPVVGNLISGTYTKVDSLTEKPSVTIKSPVDKVSAIKAVATTGHLEFDVSGFVKTHLDLDVAADEPGVAKIRVASPLIPKLPFKNKASLVPAGGTSSPWKIVTDLGNGKSYYFNEETGIAQYDKPKL